MKHRALFCLASLSLLVLAFQLTGWPRSFCVGGYSYFLLRAFR